MRATGLGLALGVTLLIATALGGYASDTSVFVRDKVATTTRSTTPEIPTNTTRHLPTPEPMYAIYMTQCAVGTPSLRNSLVEFIDTTKLNAVVIDIKDYSGTIAFKPEHPELLPAWQAAKCGAQDMKEFIEVLHEKNIYVIGRITVFQDPFYTARHPEQSVQSKARPGQPWKDHKGLSFVAVNSTSYWEHIVTLSKESYAIGFDELNYDYVRWPSDGPMDDIVYPTANRAEELEKFFAYLAAQVKPLGVVMSADLFGYVTVLTDDLGIGQQLERALPYFDYIAPMVYPSHYNKGFAGVANPNNDPYKVVYTSMAEAARRAEATTTPVASFGAKPFGSSTPQLYSKQPHSRLKLRPWLQDFDYGKDYTAQDILDQTRATYDAGLTSWYFWDPANRYSALRATLTVE
jgi:hypothetical protein